MAAQRRRDDRGTGKAGQGNGGEGWLCAGQNAAPDEGRSLPPVRSPPLLCGEYVSTDGTRGRKVLRQANELPDASQDLRFQGTLLSRPSRPPCRVWDLLPL